MQALLNGAHRWTGRLLPVAVLILVLIGVRPVAAQQPTGSPLLQELAERLLTPAFTAPAGVSPSVVLLPGAVPPNLPFDLVVPPGGRLIGSAVRMNPSSGEDEIYFVLDAPGDPASVLQFFQGAFEEQNWTVPVIGGPSIPRGFQSVNQVLFTNFCRSERGPWVSLNVIPRESLPNDVRLNLNDFPGPCSGAGRPSEPPFGPPGEDRVPLIATPPGVTITRSTTLIGPGTWGSFAVADSTRPVAEIEAAVADQLEFAGWIRQDGRAVAPVAWSTWAVPGEGDWQGVLTVVAGPREGQRTLQVQVIAPEIPVDGPRR